MRARGGAPTHVPSSEEDRLSRTQNLTFDSCVLCCQQGGSGVLLEGGGAVCPPELKGARVDPGCVHVHEDAKRLPSLFVKVEASGRYSVMTPSDSEVPLMCSCNFSVSFLRVQVNG